MAKKRKKICKKPDKVKKLWKECNDYIQLLTDSITKINALIGAIVILCITIKHLF